MMIDMKDIKQGEPESADSICFICGKS